MRILVIGAHPDDELLGVGGTIIKHIAQGDEVRVCIVTKAWEPLWTKEYIGNKIDEQRDVDLMLGVSKRYNLDFPTVKLNTIPHGELNGRVAEVVRDFNPDVVYTHFESDLNFDHTLVFRATMVATRPPLRIKVVCYETVSETEWNDKPFLPNLWVDIKPHLEKKIQAFQIYKSEQKEFPHSRSVEALRALSSKRGMEVCLENAEAFKVVRDYWS